MAKIIEGVALAAAGFLTFEVGGFFFFGEAATLLTQLGVATIGIGASLTLSGIAAILQAGPGSPFSIRQAAAPRVCIYGQSRVSGVFAYLGTSGNGGNINQVIVWAAHSCQSVETLYLDGRQLHLSGTQGDGATYTDDSGNQYSFGPTDVEYCSHTLGTVPGAYFSTLGSADSNWNSTCTLDGLTCTYIKCGYDANRYSGAPGIKATIYGKNDIYDPRTATRGYTNNAALVIADFLCNSDWGIGCNFSTEIDQAQLIAAANICDEQVALAAGGTESRYTINGSFDSSSTPGEILDALLQCCEGRISYTGGVWKIYPASWYGATLTFGPANLIDKFAWTAAHKYRDRVNTVRATYISPRYPYAVTGYDQDNKDTSIFSGEWQPTDMPEYAQDSGHGYSTDANLGQDGGVKLYATRSYRFCTSVSMCQRLAKIYLLRNRFGGSTTFRMNLAAYQLQAQDVFYVNFPAMSWANKYFEVDKFQLVAKTDDQGKEAPTIYCEVTVNETDPSIYYWSDVEERGVANTPSPVFADPYTVLAPTALTITTGQAEAIVGADGIIRPRILIQWTPTADPFVASGGYVEAQFYANGNWNPIGQFSPLISTAYFDQAVSGTIYYVRLRNVRANGATSAWTQAGPEVATCTGSLVSYSYGLNTVANPGFESNILGGLCDSWTLQDTDPSVFTVGRVTDVPNSGASAMLIRTIPNAGIAPGYTAQCRVLGALTSISGNQPLYYGGYLYWASAIALNPNLVFIGRVGLYFLDVDKNFITETAQQLVNAPNYGYAFLSGTCTTPPNAAYMYFDCGGFVMNNSSSVGFYVPNGYCMDLRFDDVFAYQQSGSGLLAAQGSVNPSQGIVIPGSFTNSSCTLSWSAQTVLTSSPGQTVTTNSGSVTYSSLSPSTTYYTYWRIRVSDGSVQAVNGSPPPTTPNDSFAIQMAVDGYITIGVISFTTLAASNTGTGSQGGGDTCPIHTELVNVIGKGDIQAGDVVIGDYIQGHSFASGTDIYRRVAHVRWEHGAAWRSVDGHLVSPCESIYHGGKWQPAYQVSAEADHTVGKKIMIAVDADSDGEHNYYLVSGTKLLIHNQRIYGC